MTLRLARASASAAAAGYGSKASMKVVAAETANTIRRPPARRIFRHRFGTRDPSALAFLINDSARGSRCPSLMVWLVNSAHPRLDLGSGRNVCRALWGALTQRCLRARLGSAAFKIVGAPHMAPYMVSIGRSFLLTPSTQHSLGNALSLGNIVTRPH